MWDCIAGIAAMGGLGVTQPWPATAEDRFPKRGWLSAPRSVQQSVARRHHQIIVDRFRKIVRSQRDMPLPIPAISRQMGISDCCLREACKKQIGVSPGQYVILFRLHSA